MRRLQTHQLCKICCVPAPAMSTVNRRDYQDYKAWESYGTASWWARVAAEPWLALETVAQRLRLAGLVCPAETTSAVIAAAICCLTHGPMVGTLAQEQIESTYIAFKVRRVRMRASHHTSYNKHLPRGDNRDCASCNRVNIHLCKLFCVHVRPINFRRA